MLAGKQSSGNVMASRSATNTVQGDIQSASIGTYMAINGEGFFVVAEAGGLSPTIGRSFDGIDKYTRRGDFQPTRTAIWSTAPAIT